MNTQLAVVDHGKDLKVTQDQMTIARNTVAKGLNDDQFAVFLYNCSRQGVHPLDGLVVPIVRKDHGEDKLTFVTTVDLLRSRAAETGEYAGVDDATFEYFEIGKAPVAATVTVWRLVQGQKCSFTATCRYDEYYPGDKQGFMWQSKPHVMLGKCAEGAALRKGFPKELAGLYLEEELAKENKPRATKPAPAPVGNVKCSQCNAIGGHLPHCPTRKQPATTAAPEQVSPKEENVMCGDCGKVNGHTPECKYAKADVADDGLTETVVLINKIDLKQTKVTDPKKTARPYLMMEVTDRENLEWVMYVWHASLFQYLKPKQTMFCRFSTRQDRDKTFCSLEKVLELAGVQFVDNKPVMDPKGRPVGDEPNW